MSQNIPMCNQYTYNPYLCVNPQESNIVVPQGQVIMPNTPAPYQQINTNQPLNYNQITPYVNTSNGVFTPSIEMKNPNKNINFNYQTPVINSEAQIVYEGPVSNINPQITPDKSIDAKIEQDYEEYFKNKAKYNSELNDALSAIKHNRKTTGFYKSIKILSGVTLVTLAAIYRKKIPLLNKIFK